MTIQEDKFNITIKKVHKIYPKKLINTLCIQGMPGIANAGKGALDFIAKQLEAKRIMEIYFSDFPSHVKVNSSGCLYPSKIELLHYREKSLKRDLLLLTADTQPASNIGMNVLSKYLAKILKELGVTMVISLAAKPLTSPKRKPQVFVTATSKELVESFSQLENVNILNEGSVVGMNGIIPVICKSLYNIDGVILLSESCKMFNYDVAAAYALVKVLKSKLGLNIDISILENEIKLQWENAGKITEKEINYKEEKKPDYIS
ncbi:MAG: PAC2 family protein [Candidatus Jordarchaeaceae archaeon]